MTESAKNEWQDWTSDILWVVRQRFPTMRLNVWVVLTILIVLFAITRYMRQQQTPDICRDDPTASVCER
jgi:hypothetical protein